MTRITKVAVVGVGHLGRIHAKIYNEMNAVELVAVVDSDATVAEQIAREYSCDSYTDIEALFDKVDAVSIVVPTSLHRSITEPFLQRGISVMLEKPVADSVEDSQAIVELAEKNNVLLQIGHLERFNAGVMKLAELSDSPKFIEVHRLGQFVGRATDVDVVTDLMIHDIDIVLSLVKSELKTISATGIRVITDHVDIANARLEFENKTIANITASRVSRDRYRRIRVFSDHCYYALDFETQQLQQAKPITETDNADFPEIEFSDIEVSKQMPLNAELAAFIDCVNNKKQPLVDGRIGLLAVTVAEQVREKIKYQLS